MFNLSYVHHNLLSLIAFNIPLTNAKKMDVYIPIYIHNRTSPPFFNKFNFLEFNIDMCHYVIFRIFPLEIMSDEELMESIKKGLRDIEEGNVVDFEEFIKETAFLR